MNNHIGDVNKMVCPRCWSGDPRQTATGRIYECDTLVEYIGAKEPIVRQSVPCHIIAGLKAYTDKLEAIGDAMRPWCNDTKSCEAWDKVREEKP